MTVTMMPDQSEKADDVQNHVYANEWMQRGGSQGDGTGVSKTKKTNGRESEDGNNVC